MWARLADPIHISKQWVVRRCKTPSPPSGRASQLSDRLWKKTSLICRNFRGSYPVASLLFSTEAGFWVSGTVNLWLVTNIALPIVALINPSRKIQSINEQLIAPSAHHGSCQIKEVCLQRSQISFSALILSQRLRGSLKVSVGPKLS